MGPGHTRHVAVFDEVDGRIFQSEQCCAKVIQKLEELKYIPAEKGSGDYSEEDEEKVVERLKGLGYVE